MIFQPFEKKEGSGAGNWGTAEDELQGQTEKVEGQTEGEKTDEPKEEVEQKEEVPPPEPEEKTMTLEEYYASRKKSNRNPNAKLTDEKTPVSIRQQTVKIAVFTFLCNVFTFYLGSC